MKARIFCLVAVACAASATAGEAQLDPDSLYQQAWYLEEGLRDPARAVALYMQVASRFPENKAIAAKALTRAAGCYKKLGREDTEREIWVKAWQDYKEEIEKSPEYQHDSIRIISRIEKDLAVGSSDVAKLFGDILDQMQAVHIIPVRNRMLQQAQEQRKHNPLSALRALRFAILLSTKLKDHATAAMAQSQIGEIWFELEAFKDAVEAYSEARRDYPNQRAILAWNQLKMAEAFRMMPRPLDAVEYYKELLRDYSEQKEQVLWGTLWLGDCFRELGNLDRAKKTWTELARSEEAKAHPRQRRIARILSGLDPPALAAPVGDEFDNDEAYFVAVRYKMDGNIKAARELLKLTIERSVGKDWPYMLAGQYLTSGGLDGGGH